MFRLDRRIALGVLALSLAGCVDLDERLVSNVSSQYYGTPDGLNAAVSGAYSQLRNHWGREESAALSQMGTDTWMNGDQVSSGAQSWFYFNDYGIGLNSADDRLRFTWVALYQLVNTVNAVLERGPGTQGMDPAVKASRLGEAHFLRALAYFQLVQTWGDVTLTTTENQGIVVTAARAPAADVYKVIIADLDTAITQLPATQPQWGRATKGAAQHLLAKVYLTRAYKDYGEKTADFQKSLDLATAVINSGTYSLVPVYANLWCVARAADPGRQGYCEVNGLNEQNSEVIFPVQFSNTATQFDANTNNYLHLVYLSNYDNSDITRGMLRDLNNGRPFRRLRPSPYAVSLFDYKRWVGTPGQSDVLDTRWDGSFQTVWIANNAAPGGNATGPCPRCTSGQPINVGDTALYMPGYQVSDAFRLTKKYQIVTPCVTAPTQDCGRSHAATDNHYDWRWFPSLKKFQDNTRTSVSDQDSGKDIYLMRLGETYLIAAEAALGLGQPAQAAGFINVVRRRAASPAHKTENDIGPADVTLDFIMDERERELSGELNRWYDLVRPGPDFFVRRVKAYNPEAAANVKPTHALRPIPQAQIDLTRGGYPQNPGY